MLKLSGEALQGGMGFGVDPKVSDAMTLMSDFASVHGINMDILEICEGLPCTRKMLQQRRQNTVPCMLCSDFRHAAKRPALVQVLKAVAREVRSAARQGVEIAIVVGGGNYFRGSQAWEGLERASADYVGMLATCMNALMLQVTPWQS